MDYPRLSAKEAEVLRLLIANSEMYGLELVKRSADIKRGTVYVTLSRMTEKGYVDSRVEEVAIGEGPPRRLYKATGLGVRAFRAMQSSNAAFVAAWGV
jgi:PadR family transcriptional regulator, regulatory protein PadR